MRRVASDPHHVILVLVLLLPFTFFLPAEDAFALPKEAALVFGMLWTVAATAAWLRRQGPQTFLRGRDAFLLAGFAAWMVASVLWSGNPARALREALPLLSAVVLFGVVALRYGHRDPDGAARREVLQAIAFVAGLEAVVCLAQFTGLGLQFGSGEGKWRVIGTFGNPNYVAWFLVPGALVALGLARDEVSRRRRFLFQACFGLAALAVLATFSRGGSVVLALGLAGMLWAEAARRGLTVRALVLRALRRRRGITALLVTASLLLLLAAPFVKTGILSQAVDTDSFAGRVFLWQNGLAAAWRALPFGAGIGDFEPAYTAAQYRHFADGALDGADHAWIAGRQHNDYLQLLVELGAGALFFWFFAGRVARRAWRALRSGATEAGIALGVLSLAVTALFDFPLRSAPTLFLFAVLGALLVAVERVPLPERRARLLPLVELPGKYRWLLVAVLVVIGHLPLRFLAGDYLYHAGKSHKNEGRVTEAVALLEAATRLDPGAAEPAAHLAEIKRSYGRISQARTLVAAAVASSPLPHALRESALCALAGKKTAAYLETMRLRAYAYRRVVPYAAEYIDALHRQGKNAEATAETALLNRLVERLRHVPAEWYTRLEQANDTALAAAMARKGGAWRAASAAGLTCLELWHGRVLAGTAGAGLFEFDPATRAATPLLSPRLSFVRALRVVQGALWAGTEDGLYGCQAPGKAWYRIGVPGAQTPRVTAILSVAGKTYLTTPQSFVEHDTRARTWKTRVAVDGRPLLGLGTLAAGFGAVYAGGRGQLLVCSGGTSWQLHDVPAAGVVRAVLPVGQRRVLLGTDDGVLAYDMDTRALRPHALPGEPIRDLGLGNGVVWALGARRGPTPLGPLADVAPAALKTVFAASRMRFLTDVLWGNSALAAMDDGLAVHGPGGERRALLTTPSNRPGADIAGLAVDGTWLYAADRRRVWSWDGKTFAAITGVDGHFGGMRTTRSGAPAAWCAVGNTLYRLVDGTARAAHVVPGPIRAFDIATNGAFLLWGDGSGRWLPADGPPADFDAGRDTVAVALCHGLLALGSDAGVRLLSTGRDPATVLVLDRSNGLPDNEVTGLAARDGELWIGTARGGLAVWSPASGTIVSARAGRAVAAAPVVVCGPQDNGWLLSLQGRRLRVSGAWRGHALAFQGDDAWPLVPLAAVLWRGTLVVGGAGGLGFYPGFADAARPWRDWLEAGR